MPTFMKSVNKNKKYSTIYNGKTINFGDSKMEQYKDSTGLGLYTSKDHLDPVRRKSYLARAKGIKNAKGELTWKMKSSPNYYSVRFLW
jgi:hypothetical protein